MSRRLFDELQSSLSPASLEVRGENAWSVATRFLQLLQENIPEEDERKKLMATWMRSVQHNDFSKFKRALKRYYKRRDET